MLVPEPEEGAFEVLLRAGGEPGSDRCSDRFRGFAGARRAIAKATEHSRRAPACPLG
jgi:hypothetical protein